MNKLIWIAVLTFLCLLTIDIVMPRKAESSTPNWQINGHKQYGQMLNQTNQRSEVIKNERHYYARKSCAKSKSVSSCIALIMLTHEINDKETK